MQMLRVGGHFIGFTPANNLCGHGFYQFSPELFFRVFSFKNGFNIKLMAMHGGDGNKHSTDVYLVKDPDDFKTRIEFESKKAVSLIVIAEKIKDTDLFAEFPQQSDYSTIWSDADAKSDTLPTENVSTLRTLYRERIPLKIRNIVYGIYHKIRYRKTHFRGFAKVHKRFVDKLEI